MKMDLKVVLRLGGFFDLEDVTEICTSHWPGMTGPKGETVVVYQASGGYMIFWREDIKEVKVRFTKRT